MVSKQGHHTSLQYKRSVSCYREDGRDSIPVTDIVTYIFITMSRTVLGILFKLFP